MPELFEEVSLEYRGNIYTLRRLSADGQLSEIKLTETNLLSLLPLIQRECAQLLASRTTPGLKEHGVEPIVTIPVARFVVGNDLHQTEIYLTLEDKDGNAYRFSFDPPDGVRRIARRLTERADQLAPESTTKQ
jgi:hypothetical protein